MRMQERVKRAEGQAAVKAAEAFDRRCEAFLQTLPDELLLTLLDVAEGVEAQGTEQQAALDEMARLAVGFGLPKDCLDRYGQYGQR